MDNATLLLALAVLSSICSIALIANWAANRFIPGLLPMAVGYSITTVGILLTNTQEQLAPVYSVAFATVLVIVGRVFLLFGLAAFWNQEKSRIPLACLVWGAISSMGFVYFTLVEDVVQWRGAFFILFMIVFFLMGAFVLIRGLLLERRMRPNLVISTTYGAYFLIGLFLFNAAADVFLLLTRPSVPIMVTDPNTFYLLLNHFVTMATIGFAVIMMTMEELSVEHKENSLFDPITAALNHRTFLEAGQRAVGIALRHSQPVSLLTLEILNYEQISSQFNTKIANKFLRHVTSRTTDSRRNEDLLGRCSLTEFCLLLPGIDEAGAATVVKRIEEALHNGNFRHESSSVPIDFVISAVTKREEYLNLQQMLQEGELEMFKVKKKLEKLPV